MKFNLKLNNMIQNLFNPCKKCFLIKSYKVNLFLSAPIHKYYPIVFENTLVYTVLQHFKGNPMYETHFTNTTLTATCNDQKNILKDKTCVASISTDELLTHMISIASKKDIKDNEIIKNVDQELCKRLHSEIDDYRDVLRIADSLLYFTHNAASKTKSYKLCIESIMGILRWKEITLPHFIQCAFYTSILKKDPLARVTMTVILKKIYFRTEIINTISPVELAIFCNSVYKTGTEIRSKKVVNAVVNAIENGTSTLFSNEVLLTSILKPLHQAKYHHYTFLKKLSKDILSKNLIDVNSCQLSGVLNLFKLYSNALYNDKSVTDYLVKLAVTELKYKHENMKYIRAKDISILLKSCCELGDVLINQLISDNVVPIVYDAVTNRLFQQNELRSLTEILLWISIIDVELLKEDFIENFITPQLIMNGTTTVKGVARMNLFLTILSIEKRVRPEKEESFLKLVQPTEGSSQEKLIIMRPKLYEIYKAVKCLAVTNTNITDVRYDCQVPNLYMPGVTVETNTQQKIAIECLDDKVCLYNTESLNGYMKLKSRLLKKLGYTVVTIPQRIVDEGSECLFTTVEDTIKEVNDVL